jgi:hypothetical protein
MHPATSSLFCELDKLADFTFYTLDDFSVHSVNTFFNFNVKEYTFASLIVWLIFSRKPLAEKARLTQKNSFYNPTW